jgi:hypothetical protein
MDGFDGPLITLNFLYLALVTLVPFSCELVGDYGEEPQPVIFYAANMAILGAVGSVMVIYAFRRLRPSCGSPCSCSQGRCSICSNAGHVASWTMRSRSGRAAVGPERRPGCESEH